MLTAEKRHRFGPCLTRDRGLFSSPCFLTERAAARPTLSAGIVPSKSGVRQIGLTG